MPHRPRWWTSDLPMMLPKAQTACSHTFWWGEWSSLRNRGTASVHSHTKKQQNDSDCRLSVSGQHCDEHAVSLNSLAHVILWILVFCLTITEVQSVFNMAYKYPLWMSFSLLLSSLVNDQLSLLNHAPVYQHMLPLRCMKLGKIILSKPLLFLVFHSHELKDANDWLVSLWLTAEPEDAMFPQTRLLPWLLDTTGTRIEMYCTPTTG